MKPSPEEIPEPYPSQTAEEFARTQLAIMQGGLETQEKLAREAAGRGDEIQAEKHRKEAERYRVNAEAWREEVALYQQKTDQG